MDFGRVRDFFSNLLDELQVDGDIELIGLQIGDKADQLVPTVKGFAPVGVVENTSPVNAILEP